MLKMKYRASMKSPITPTINAIIGMLFLKVLMGGIANTQNSDLFLWGNFGPKGALSGLD